MIILANILLAIGQVLEMLIGFMIFVVFARAILSWVNPDPYNPIVRFLTAATEPLLRPLRRYIPLVANGLDITPLILLLILYFLKIALVQTILDYGVQMRGIQLHPALPGSAEVQIDQLM